MKFFCEYCGARIDANEDDKCPNCGASYKKNKTFLRLEAEKKEQQEKVNQMKNEVIQTTIQGFKFSRWFIFLPIIIFVVVFVIIIISATGMFRSDRSTGLKNGINKIEQAVEKGLNEVEEEISKEPEPVTVNGLNNYGSVNDYEFMVTGYEVVTSKWPDDYTGDNVCVKFYFQVKNTSGKKIHKEDVNCIVDGVAQKQSMFGHNTMEYSIGKDLTVKGSMEFMVPKNATSYDIKYGDYITVHIEK